MPKQEWPIAVRTCHAAINRDRNPESACPCPEILWLSSEPPGTSSPINRGGPLWFHGLLEDRLAAAILLAHGFGRGLHVAEGLRLHGSRVGDYGTSLIIDLEHGTGTRAGNFEVGRLLGHLSE